jgi:hypothetical protein
VKHSGTTDCPYLPTRMALSSGVYIIENVRNRNWAILTNDNDGDDVISGTNTDTDEGHKVERFL